LPNKNHKQKKTTPQGGFLHDRTQTALRAIVLIPL